MSDENQHPPPPQDAPPADNPSTPGTKTPVPEKPKTPAPDEKPKTPAPEEKPKTPAPDEKPKTPVPEKPKTPVPDKPKTPGPDEKPKTPAPEGAKTPSGASPERPQTDKSKLARKLVASNHRVRLHVYRKSQTSSPQVSLKRLEAQPRAVQLGLVRPVHVARFPVSNRRHLRRHRQFRVRER